MGQIRPTSSLLLDTISVQDPLKSYDGTLTGFTPILGPMLGPMWNSFGFYVLINLGSINPLIDKFRFYARLGFELGPAFAPDSNHRIGPIETPFWVRSSSRLKYNSMINRQSAKLLNGATFSNDHSSDAN